MENNASRAGFATKLGGLLAAAGSAVGLGNIWRFPTQAGQNGGSAFLLVYLVIIFIFGIPLLISEFAIGRHAKANVGNAYNVLAPRSFWKVIGVASVFVAAVILCYYNVVVAWVLFYLQEAVAGTFVSLGEAVAAGDTDAFANNFVNFISNPWKPLIYLLIVLALIHSVIVLGVEKGIERLSKFLMPMLFVLLILLVIFASTMPGAVQAYNFLFDFDLSKVTPDVCLSALGQCFYSFSIGMGIVTYASYFRRDVNLNRTALSVGFLDTIVAIMAGLVIFPAVFSVQGAEPSAGAGLVFISLPSVFNSSLQSVPFLNWLIPSLFYFVLLVAALTSAMFLHEVATAFVSEHLGMKRKHAALCVTVWSLVIGIGASLSMGPLDEYKILDRNFFDFLDYITSQIILPLTGMGAALFVGWKMTTYQLWYELTSRGSFKFIWLKPFLFLVRFVIPALIAVIMVTQLFNIKISEVISAVKFPVAEAYAADIENSMTEARAEDARAAKIVNALGENRALEVIDGLSESMAEGEA